MSGPNQSANRLTSPWPVSEVSDDFIFEYHQSMSVVVRFEVPLRRPSMNCWVSDPTELTELLQGHPP